MKKNKRGVSPIIATVLLVAIVVVLSMIIFLWARGFVSESVLKNGKPAYQVCALVSLEANYINGKLQVTNKGNIPLTNLRLKKYNQETVESTEEQGLAVGESISIRVGTYEKIEIFPVIMGTLKDSEQRGVYTCDTSFIVK